MHGVTSLLIFSSFPHLSAYWRSARPTGARLNPLGVLRITGHRRRDAAAWSSVNMDGLHEYCALIEGKFVEDGMTRLYSTRLLSFSACVVEVQSAGKRPTFFRRQASLSSRSTWPDVLIQRYRVSFSDPSACQMSDLLFWNRARLVGCMDCESRAKDRKMEDTECAKPRSSCRIKMVGTALPHTTPFVVLGSMRMWQSFAAGDQSAMDKSLDSSDMTD